MKVKVLAASIMLLAGTSVMAQTYQWEAGASITHVDPDLGNSDESIGAYGEYHFSPVITANRPLAEAAFLQRSSNAYVYGAQDLDLINAGVEFYIPNSIFYVAAEIARVDIGGERNNDWGVRFGLTPLDGLLVWTSYYDEPGYDLNLHAKYVLDLGHLNAINIEAGYTDDDFDNSLYLFGDYYFNRTFSVGAGYAEQYDIDSFTVRARKFFTNQISGELAFTDADYGKSFTLGGSMRF
jgi:hypothetical protein